MVSIKNMSDNQLLEHITVNQELLDSTEFGSADYNSAASELTVAYHEQKLRTKMRKCEDKRVDVILQEVDQEYSIPSYMEEYVKRGIARALKKIDQQSLLKDIMMEQLETM